MSSFDTHDTVGKMVALASATGVYLAGLETGITTGHAIGLAVGAAILAYLTAILPDIDAKSSIPRRRFGRISLILTGGGVAAYIFTNPTVLDPLVGVLITFVPEIPYPRAVGMILAVGFALIGATAFGSLFDRLTVHRGLLHSPILGVALGAITVGALYFVGIKEQIILWAFGAVATAGHLAHIVTDKLG